MRLILNARPGVKSIPALFLDRDGVINNDYGYVHRKENFEFKSGIFELISAANLAGYFCIVITNQSGIGRGLYSVNDFRVLSNWMCEQFKNKGARLDAIYFSPFHPTEGKGAYLCAEDTRKPGPGMFNEAAIDLKIDLSKSAMVGDKPSDMEASLSAGISNNYFLCSDQTTEPPLVLDKKIKKFCDIPSITTHFSEKAAT